jgi:hypothetical protein
MVPISMLDVYKCTYTLFNEYACKKIVSTICWELYSTLSIFVSHLVLRNVFTLSHGKSKITVGFAKPVQIIIMNKKPLVIEKNYYIGVFFFNGP